MKKILACTALTSLFAIAPCLAEPENNNAPSSNSDQILKALLDAGMDEKTANSVLPQIKNHPNFIDDSATTRPLKLKFHSDDPTTRDAKDNTQSSKPGAKPSRKTSPTKNAAKILIVDENGNLQNIDPEDITEIHEGTFEWKTLEDVRDLMNSDENISPANGGKSSKAGMILLKNGASLEETLKELAEKSGIDNEALENATVTLGPGIIIRPGGSTAPKNEKKASSEMDELKAELAEQRKLIEKILSKLE